MPLAPSIKKLFLLTLFLSLVIPWNLGSASDEESLAKRARTGGSPFSSVPAAALEHPEQDRSSSVELQPAASSVSSAAVPPVLLPAPVLVAMVAASASASSLPGSADRVEEEGKPFTDPLFDTSFKHMLGVDDEDDEDAAAGAARAVDRYSILNCFISSFLDTDVRIAATLSPFIPPLREHGETQQIMDIACQDRRGYRYNIEVQRAKQTYWDARALYYMSSLYETQISKSDYEDLRPVVGISILGFDRDDFTTYKRRYQLADTTTFPVAGVADAAPIKVLSHLTLIEICLPKVDLASLPDSVEKQWLTLLKTAAQVADIPTTVTHPLVRQAWERLRFSTFGGTVKSRYTREEAAYREEQVRIAEAEERGVKKGQEKEKLGIALAMIAQGAATFTNETIADLTKIPLEQIIGLRAESHAS